MFQFLRKWWPWRKKAAKAEEPKIDYTNFVSKASYVKHPEDDAVVMKALARIQMSWPHCTEELVRDIQHAFPFMTNSTWDTQMGITALRATMGTRLAGKSPAEQVSLMREALAATAGISRQPDFPSLALIKAFDDLGTTWPTTEHLKFREALNKAMDPLLGISPAKPSVGQNLNPHSDDYATRLRNRNNEIMSDVAAEAGGQLLGEVLIKGAETLFEVAGDSVSAVVDTFTGGGGTFGGGGSSGGWDDD